MATKVIFITGTDTGVGKTLLTALLLHYLRSCGARAIALKPFCSGGRADAELLHRLQGEDLTLDEVNPFYFPEPVAPLISMRKHRRQITLHQVVDHVRKLAARLSTFVARAPVGSSTQNSKFKIQNYLLVEGSGGLLVPLGHGYTVRDLIVRLRCEVIIVARNQLGTINHTLLTAQSLGSSSPSGRSPIKVVLMDSASPDPSCATNPGVLRELLSPIPLIRLPFLGPRCASLAAIKRHAIRNRGILARVLH